MEWLKYKCQQMVMENTFDYSTWEAEAGRSLKFEVSQIYRATSRTVKDTQRSPISKQQQQNKAKTKQNTVVRYL